MAEVDDRIPLDWDALQVGEVFEKFEYVLTQEMIEEYRRGVMDPEAAFPTISHKVDVRQFNARYSDNGSVNARCAFHCYNSPVAGKKLTVTAWVADKYLRRGKNYIRHRSGFDRRGRTADRPGNHPRAEAAMGGRQEMGGVDRSFQEGDRVEPLVKEITQEAINLFEGSAGQSGPSQFTDEEAARETLGTSGTVASGRMSISFALEMLRRYFGGDVFNRTGMVDLRFLRPVRPGDSVTFSGRSPARRGKPTARESSSR